MSWLTRLWIGFVSRAAIHPMSCMKAGLSCTKARPRRKSRRTLELAQLASNSRLQNPSIGIRELLESDWYYIDAGPVYSIGGAFVDFLIRTRGAARFPSILCGVPAEYGRGDLPRNLPDRS